MHDLFAGYLFFGDLDVQDALLLAYLKRLEAALDEGEMCSAG